MKTGGKAKIFNANDDNKNIINMYNEIENDNKCGDHNMRIY